MLLGEMRAGGRRGCVLTFQDWGVLSSRNRSLPLLPRVLESLLVSLVTTAVVFVASMVLGECRQMSSSSQIGNDSLLLQVTPVQLRPLSYVHKKDPGMRVVSLFRAAECAGRVVPCLIGLPRKGRVWPPFYVSQRAPSVSFTPPTEPAVTVNSGLSGLSLSLEQHYAGAEAREVDSLLLLRAPSALLAVRS